MPENPYAEDEIRRRAQVGMLRGQEPTSNTMPVDGSTRSVTPAGSSWRVAPISAPPPPGWDAGNWSNPDMQSVKYRAGRLLHGLTRPSDVGRRVQSPEFQSAFPGATFNGKDWIDFAGALSDGDRGSPVNGIDVLMAADPEADTSNGIWWGAPEAEAVASAAPSGASGQVDPRGLLASDNSSLARIMRELSATQNDEPSPAEREAILAMLQGGI